MPGIDEIVEKVGGSPLALANVARTLLLPKGQTDRARALCARALAMAPGDGEVRAIHAEVFSANVPSCYFYMVRDSPRHAAYGRVLDRALRAGGRVLDIGAGTGLFAMMAARAGADEVISCERRPAVAEATRAVVARNGLGERVKVVAKASTDLAVGVDMDGPADVLIWDNLANNLIGVGALPAIEDAMRRLVKPGGRVIPAGAAVKAALAEDRRLCHRRMGMVDGYDLSAFNAVARPSHTLDCHSPDLLVRSEATTLFAFDFRSGGPYAACKTLNPVTANGGPANGVVQWLDFELDELDRYETAPGGPVEAFGLEFHPATEAFDAAPGEVFLIGAAHDREQVRIWLEGH